MVYMFSGVLLINNPRAYQDIPNLVHTREIDLDLDLPLTRSTTVFMCRDEINILAQ